MRVRVDHELCESNAICVRLVPEVFELDGDDRLRVKPTVVDDVRLAEAVRRCPKQALALVDESDSKGRRGAAGGDRS